MLMAHPNKRLPNDLKTDLFVNGDITLVINDFSMTFCTAWRDSLAVFEVTSAAL